MAKSDESDQVEAYRFRYIIFNSVWKSERKFSELRFHPDPGLASSLGNTYLLYTLGLERTNDDARMYIKTITHSSKWWRRRRWWVVGFHSVDGGGIRSIFPGILPLKAICFACLEAWINLRCVPTRFPLCTGNTSNVRGTGGYFYS